MSSKQIAVTVHYEGRETLPPTVIAASELPAFLSQLTAAYLDGGQLPTRVETRPVTEMGAQ